MFVQCNLHALGRTVTSVVVVMLLEKFFGFDLDLVQFGVGSIGVMMEQDECADICIDGQLPYL